MDSQIVEAILAQATRQDEIAAEAVKLAAKLREAAEVQRTKEQNKRRRPDEFPTTP